MIVFRPTASAVLLGLVTACALAGPVRAADRTLDELQRALTRFEAEAGAAGPASRDALAAAKTLLGELERRDRAKRMEFGVAGAKALPAKAAERLALARAAYEAGHGRLLRLLHEIAQTPAGTPDEDVRARLKEAREILEKLQEAARQEPISSGDLKVKAPSIQAAPLRAGSGRAAIVGEQGPIGLIPAALKDQAASLAGPVEIYEWVRGNIVPEFYHGAMKGALETLLEGSGNDADTAALLIGLLRAKGIPARYVRGTAEIPGDLLTAVTGTARVEQAVRVLERAGIPHEAALAAGGVASIKVERTWAEAYLPYANYRGALLDTQGKFWIPMDANLKRLGAPRGMDVVKELGFDPRAAFDDYLSAPQSVTPREFVRDRVTGLLATARPDLQYADVLNSRTFASPAVGLLPSSLPYKVLETAEVAYDVPETLRHSIRFAGDAGGVPILDVTVPVSEKGT